MNQILSYGTGEGSKTVNDTRTTLAELSQKVHTAELPTLANLGSTRRTARNARFENHSSRSIIVKSKGADLRLQNVDMIC